MNNLKLKAKIIERFETQFRFSHEVGVLESTVSRVISGVHSLPIEEKQRWAKTLQCKVKDIFPNP